MESIEEGEVTTPRLRRFLKSQKILSSQYYHGGLQILYAHDLYEQKHTFLMDRSGQRHQRPLIEMTSSMNTRSSSAYFIQYLKVDSSIHVPLV
jgi:hypothetical protein